MCTIIGFTENNISKSEVSRCLTCTRKRGPDGERIEDAGKGLIGFQRLSIMGLTPEGMQPFSLGSSKVVCNGEIYGFRPIREQLAKKYTFKSDSDCEILLPMYREYGLKMFSMLDAEFALILYDGEKDEFVAARDPIGIRPLFYGKHGSGLAFSSEANNLAGICERIYPFPPGCYYANGEFTRYCDIAKPETVNISDVETVCKNIHDKLIAGVSKRLDSDAPLGFLLSGGLDSSLVCSIAARELKKPIKTFAVGMTTDAIDLKYAKEVAEYIGSEHTEFYMTDDDVLAVLPELVRALATYDITTIRASIGMYLLCKQIRAATDVRVLLTGEISDEMFGYKYTDFAPSPEAFQTEAEKRIRELYMYDVLRADRCISSHSMEARVPFGDLDLVKYVMELDPQIKMNTYGIGKYLLRHAFEGDWLPESILMRQKAAFSDAVGHSMVDVLKAHAEQKYTDGQFTRLAAKYSHARPFTKESLMYRELFEQFYPGQAEMVVDFWMPNKTWPNCAVNDPSARVLANYGASGK